MSKGKHVVFDVVGTLVDFRAYISAIDKAIGPALKSYNITPAAFAHSWMTSSELESVFLNISERSVPYRKVMTATFYRTLFISGIPEPRKIATDEQREACVQGYWSLTLRDGAKECLDKLRAAGFQVWFFTSSDLARVQGYFSTAGVEVTAGSIISCSGSNPEGPVEKPALDAYRPVLKRFGEDDDKWFAAAHMWDVSAAVKAGFRGAYCEAYEQDALLEIYGDTMDVMAATLPEMADGIIAKSK